MTTVRGSAPGKLLVFGEYAVLAGGTAVVMAVDRRARVTIEPCDSEDLHVVAPQLGLDGEGLVFDAEHPERLLGMTGRLLAARLEHYGLDAAGLCITIDTAELFENGANGPVKLGLGSSAAVAAVLDVTLAAHAGRPPAGLDDLLPDYRKAIGGPVSGADLAASLRGGLRRISPLAAGLDVVSVEWPEGLGACPIWVGAPASTPKFASAFGDWREKQPDRAAKWLAAADALTRRTLDVETALAWQFAAGSWLDLLIELQAELDLEIVTEPHRALVDAAGDCGVAYKTCGAGGGDFGMALSADADALDAFRARAMALGGRPLELQADPAGARVESPPETVVESMSPGV